MRVRITGVSDDPYSRFVGIAVDEPLPSRFWETARDKVVGTRFRHFEYEAELSDKRHTITVGVSSPCQEPYLWSVDVYVNGKLVKSGKVCGGKFLTVSVSPAGGLGGLPLPLLLLGAAALFLFKK